MHLFDLFFEIMEEILALQNYDEPVKGQRCSISFLLEIFSRESITYTTYDRTPYRVRRKQVYNGIDKTFLTLCTL